MSHDLVSVERFCDRALLLRDGRMRALSAPAEVIEQYHNEIAAAAAQPHLAGATT